MKTFNLQKEMIAKMKDSINKTKLDAVKEKLSELNIQIDLETEMLKLFPKIKEFTDEDGIEHVYYNDGSEFGLRVISFKLVYKNSLRDFEFKEYDTYTIEPQLMWY